MATQRMTAFRAWPAWAMGLWVIGRAAGGLFVHGLVRPGAPATLSRGTGKVAPR